MHANQVSSCKTSWRDFLELCKPKVVLLMLITAVVGMHLASPGFVSPLVLFWGTLGIGLAAASAAVINHLLDRHIDGLMHRTKKRPIVAGKVVPQQALLFSLVLAGFSLLILITFVNYLTAVLSLAALIGYAVVYTIFLKRATSQNIVIGGVAGSAPPLLGWVAVTGQVDPYSLLLVLIIFTWTPPHFWSLAIYRHDDYAKAKIPMLPVTYGIKFTKRCILLYTLLLIAVSVLPFVTGMSGMLYFIAALLLGGGFLFHSLRLMFTDKAVIAMRTFRYSNIYLLALFVFLLIDHYL